MAVDIKTRGVKSKKKEIMKKKIRKAQPILSLSAQLALSKPKETGARRGVNHESQSPLLALSAQHRLSAQHTLSAQHMLSA